MVIFISPVTRLQWFGKVDDGKDGVMYRALTPLSAILFKFELGFSLRNWSSLSALNPSKLISKTGFFLILDAFLVIIRRSEIITKFPSLDILSNINVMLNIVVEIKVSSNQMMIQISKKLIKYLTLNYLIIPYFEDLYICLII